MWPGLTAPFTAFHAVLAKLRSSILSTNPMLKSDLTLVMIGGSEREVPSLIAASFTVFQLMTIMESSRLTRIPIMSQNWMQIFFQNEVTACCGYHVLLLSMDVFTACRTMQTVS